MQEHSPVENRRLATGQHDIPGDRLGLSEALNRLPDAIECMQAAVQWLVEAHGATHVICAARAEGDPPRLVVRASHGLSSDEVLGGSLDLADDSEPIVAAYLDGLQTVLSWPAGRALAVPFCATRGEPVGILVVTPAGARLRREVRWLASVLGPRVAGFTALLTAESFLASLSRERELLQQLEENLQKLGQAEAQARAERDRLDMIIDSVDDPIVATDPSGRVIHMNPPAERLLAAPSSQATREQELTVHTNDRRLTGFAADLSLTDSGMRRRGELVLTDPMTGIDIPFEAVAGRIAAAQGELTAVVIVLHDRTEAIEKARLYETIARASRTLEQKVADATAELVRQNEVLRRQHMALEQASQLKSRFLANMSHEFRTPLNAILGYTDILLEGVGGKLGPVHRRNLKRIESNAQHLSEIIADILDISKIEAGKMPINVSRFPLLELLTEVKAEIEPLLARTSLEVTMDPGGRSLVMHSDRQKIKQIVLNLLSNAIKFTPQGSIQISSRHQRGTDTVSIAVQDTGIGIAPEDQEAVFEDFRQVDSSISREYQGTGLGLSICRRLVKALGGKMKLKSALGKGSTFTLLMPRRIGRT